jgi:rhodanese-related sulfurtransferase
VSAANELPSVDVDAAAALRSTVVFLDVREDDEWAAGHAPDAIHIPLGELAERVGELAAERRVVCICRSGNRSGRANAWLRARGIDSMNMTGGMQAWAEAGHPVLDDQGRPGAVR